MYSLDKRKRIYESIKRAEVNPDWDFKKIMKNDPKSYKLPFTNKDIYRYLVQFKSFMENEEFGLLTDDKPPH